MNLYPVIMCGGSGTRLWPASRPSRPKQFIPLTGDRSLFQETVLRLQGLEGVRRLIVVAGAAHADAIDAQLAVLGVDAVVLLEPEARDSAPAMAAAGAWIAAHDPQGVAVVVASDHHIPDAEAFRAAVRHRRGRGGPGPHRHARREAHRAHLRLRLHPPRPRRRAGRGRPRRGLRREAGPRHRRALPGRGLSLEQRQLHRLRLHPARRTGPARPGGLGPRPRRRRAGSGERRGAPPGRTVPPGAEDLDRLRPDGEDRPRLGPAR